MNLRRSRYTSCLVTLLFVIAFHPLQAFSLLPSPTALKLSGMLLVPLEPLAVVSGMHIFQDPDGKVTVEREGNFFACTTGERHARANWRSLTLPCAPIAPGGTLYVPLVPLVQELGGEVEPREKEHTVTVTFPGHDPLLLTLRACVGTPATFTDTGVEIYLMPVDGGKALRISYEYGEVGLPAITRDGAKIAYLRNTLAGEQLLVRNSGEVRSDAHLTATTAHWALTPPMQFTPDGKNLLLLGQRNADNSGSPLYRLSLIGGAPSMVAKCALAPCWSADGNTMAVSLIEDEGPEMYFMAANGANLRPLGKGIPLDFSADNTLLLFAQPNQHGTNSLATCRPFDTVNTQLHEATATDRASNEIGGRFSQDGTQIVFARAGLGICSMNVDRSNLKQLTTSADDSAPLFSSDGQYILYLHAHTLMRMKSGGSEASALLDSLAVQEFELSPDGKRIILTAQPKLVVIEPQK